MSDINFMDFMEVDKFEHNIHELNRDNLEKIKAHLWKKYNIVKTMLQFKKDFEEVINNE